MNANALCMSFHTAAPAGSSVQTLAKGATVLPKQMVCLHLVMLCGQAGAAHDTGCQWVE